MLDRLYKAHALGQKQLALLIDPDKSDSTILQQRILDGSFEGVDYFFVGGSLITTDLLAETVRILKLQSRVPVILFPGNSMHLDPQADALLLLSLISGRNAEFLIGQHVVAAPVIRRTKLQVIPVGYLLVDGGKPTTVSYMSNTTPIPSDKPEIAASTAMAGEMLGLKVIYLDAGSGAERTVPPKMVRITRNHVSTPLIVGGGVRSPEQALELWKSGADVVVVGNAIEKDPELLHTLLEKARRLGSKVQ
jgi:putative glycerol-1-phosphate prenyltransferase